MTNRIFLWDNLKFFLICCVVVGHFVDQHADVSNTYGSIFLFIYSFHIPLFIFISGLFYNDKNILKKVIYFFSIGYLYKIVSAIIDRLLGNVKAEFILLSGGGISWFMFAIAIYMIIGYLLRNQNKKFIFLFSIMLACFVGYDQTIGDFLYLSRIIIFLPFFLLGLVVRNEDIVKLKKK
jgi:putative acyltransferase